MMRCDQGTQVMWPVSHAPPVCCPPCDLIATHLAC